MFSIQQSSLLRNTIRLSVTILAIDACTFNSIVVAQTNAITSISLTKEALIVSMYRQLNK